MYSIYKNDTFLFLKYSTRSGVEWIYENLSNSHPDAEQSILSGIFTVKENDIIPDLSDSESVTFKIGELDTNSGYFIIPKRILETLHDVSIFSDINIEDKLFIDGSRSSIFRKLDNLLDGPIFIGGNEENIIPYEDFLNLIDQLPTKTEVAHYYDARLTDVLKNYIDYTKNRRENFEKYLNKKNIGLSNLNNTELIEKYEIVKYEYILGKLKDMLVNPTLYSEKIWQNNILDIILFLYPKYVLKLSEVIIKDYYFGSKPKIRRIDIVLVTFDGYIDLIEIKKPDNFNIIHNRQYRDNWIPSKDLSGAIMQSEKYIFHLNKGGIKLEEDLNKKYKTLLSPELKIQVSNPKGIIVAGRSVTNNQLLDFEILKRKYSNVLDIITYDDLIRRLENIISQLKKT